jgi:hypothetical protein
MISGKRRVLVVVGAVLVGGAMIGGLLLSGKPKPVHVRQVQSSSGPEAVLSATYTTSVLGVGPTTAPPPPPPPPHVPVATTQEQPTEPKPVPKPPRPKPPHGGMPPWMGDLGGCDDAYGTDGLCVPWLFPLLVDECDWLFSHGSKRVEVRGQDRHALDRNRDGIACGKGDR